MIKTMKKIFVICMFLMSVMAISACKQEKVEVVEEEAIECAVDSTECCEAPADTLCVAE